MIGLARTANALGRAGRLGVLRCFAGSSPVSGLRRPLACGKLAAWPDLFALSFLARSTT